MCIFVFISQQVNKTNLELFPRFPFYKEHEIYMHDSKFIKVHYETEVIKNLYGLTVIAKIKWCSFFAPHGSNNL